MQSPRNAFICLFCWHRVFVLLVGPGGRAQNFRPQKPVLHGKHWVAITGKPMAATAGAPRFSSRVETPWTRPVPCWRPPPPCGTS